MTAKKVNTAQTEEAASSQEDEDFPCDFCGFSTFDLDELDEHIVVNHEEQYLKDGEQEKSSQIEYTIVPDDAPEDPKPQANQKKSTKNYRVDNSDDKEDSDWDDSESVYVCPFCALQTSKRNFMSTHLEAHKDIGKPMMYKCAECPYQTRRKPDMPKHLLTHCTDGLVEMFDCPYCTYQTKRKNDLPKHMLCHKKGINIYTCPHCEYSTKRQSDLVKHSAVHRRFGGPLSLSTKRNHEPLHNCTECGYTAKRLNNLHRHAILHCDKQYPNIFKCIKCPYGTLISSSFARHVLSSCDHMDDMVHFLTDEPGDPLEIDQGFAAVESASESNDVQIVGLVPSEQFY